MQTTKSSKSSGYENALPNGKTQLRTKFGELLIFQYISYVQSIKHSPQGMSVLLFPIILKVKDLSRCLACCRLNFCFTKITCRDCQNQQTIDMFDSKVKKNRLDKGTLCHTPKKICLEKSVVPPVGRKKIGSSYPRHAQNGGISFNRSGPAVPVQRPGCEIWWCESCGNLGAETAGTCSIWLQK